MSFCVGLRLQADCRVQQNHHQNSNRFRCHGIHWLLREANLHRKTTEQCDPVLRLLVVLKPTSSCLQPINQIIVGGSAAT